MLLADTSIVIEQSRGRNFKQAALYRSMPMACCGPIRAEVLSGARHPRERARLVSLLNLSRTIDITTADWDYIGDTRAYIFSHGVSLSLPDVAIGCVAILSNIELWSRDRAHALMSSLIPALRLYQEPP